MAISNDSDGVVKVAGRALVLNVNSTVVILEGGVTRVNQYRHWSHIADSIFQQIQTRPQEYSILATLNLNGDYISDAAAAMVGGLGMAPGANIGESAAIFEATHGTAPKHAGLNRINPGSVILSGVMMLEFLGWQEAADLITKGLSAAIADQQVTYDLARLMEPSVEPVSCSGFADAVIERF